MSKKQALIPLEKVSDGWRVSSLQIAEKLGVENRAVVQTARKYLEILEEYAGVTFEKRPLETSGGLQDAMICLLNEFQATLIVMYSKNTEQAVRLKKDLNDAFHFYREKAVASQPKLPSTYKEALKALLVEVEKKEQLELKIETDKPLVKFAEKIQDSNDATSIGEFAKILSKNGYVIGQNNLFKKLRELKLIFISNRKNVPYQSSVSSGWLKYDEFSKKIVKSETNEVINKLCTKITVTGKSQVYISNKLGIPTA